MDINIKSIERALNAPLCDTKKIRRELAIHGVPAHIVLKFTNPTILNKPRLVTRDEHGKWIICVYTRKLALSLQGMQVSYALVDGNNVKFFQMHLKSYAHFVPRKQMFKQGQGQRTTKSSNGGSFSPNGRLTRMSMSSKDYELNKRIDCKVRFCIQG